MPGNEIKVYRSIHAVSDGFGSIFEHMLNGMAYCRILFEDGCPCDGLFLYSNPAFEQQTGLRDVQGRLVSEVIPGFLEQDYPLLERFARVAQGSGPDKFEVYVNALSAWLSISAHSPEPGHIALVFDVITERKNAEAALKSSEERYQDIFDNTSDLIQCVSPDGSIIYTNRAWREAMEYTEEEARKLNLVDVLHPDSLAGCQDRFRRLLAGEQMACIRFKFVSKTGATIHLSGDCGSILRDDKVISTRGIFRNVSDTVQAETALKISEDRYRAWYENAPDIFATLSKSGEIMSINRAGAAMLGYQPGELAGESIAKIIHPEDQAEVFSYIDSQFDRFSHDGGIECRNLRKDGSVLWVHQRVTLDADADDPRLLVVSRDITDKHGLEEKLAYQATHDVLTNLINRREFERRLQRVLSGDPEAGEEHVLCFLDLDRFKVINDTCGHVAGDELLRQIAALLQGQVRSRDTLARLGGDEFAVLMEYCSLDRAVRLAEKIHAAIGQFQFHWRSRQFSIGVSIGVLSLEPGCSIEDALGQVDAACYAAKHRGRNSIQVFRLEGRPVPRDLPGQQDPLRL